MAKGDHAELEAIQAELESALCDPNFYPHPVQEVEVVETHISKVFLTGSLAYKIKKPVDFGFLDFTTLAKRHHYCEQEILLNQRLSRGICLRVVAITREPQGLALAGPGQPVEYAVEMRQLPRDRTMLELLRRGTISRQMVEKLGRVLAEFYQRAERGPEIDALGSFETVETNCEENFSQTEPFVPEILDREKFSQLQQAMRSFLARRRPLFQRRLEAGRIRDCHGDLRLEHIYFLDRIQIIDCIEFNDRFRYSDVAADLAFLAMDLDYQGFAGVGRSLLTTYARQADDPELFQLLDFYKCYRAHVRCKVECLRQAGTALAAEEVRQARDKARRYFELACGYAAAFSRQILWVVCGLSGTGKSTIAAELARRLQIAVLNSDLVRKGLFGLKPEEPAVAPFGKGIYTQAATNQTYQCLLLEARQELSRGNSVIVDATFGRRRYRHQARELAGELKASIIFVECVCPERLLRQRLAGREQGPQVADARLLHLEAQRQAFESLRELGDDIRLRVRTDQDLRQSLKEILLGAYERQGRDEQ